MRILLYYVILSIRFHFEILAGYYKDTKGCHSNSTRPRQTRVHKTNKNNNRKMKIRYGKFTNNTDYIDQYIKRRKIIVKQRITVENDQSRY